MENYKEIANMENTCIAYGCFDALHRGEMKVAAEAVSQAKAKGLTSVIVYKPVEGSYLTSEKEKEYLLGKIGVDAIMAHTCDCGLDTIIEKLGAKVLVVGEEQEDLCKVKETAEKAGVQVVVCEAEKEEGKVITGEMVREAFDACDFEKITALCGHPYVMIGEVTHGKQLGRTVGMPTANLAVADDKLKPPSGSYATTVAIDDEIFRAMTNIGKRPSVDDFDYITIEAFILDFSRDIYGKEIRLEVHKFVRGVMKFNNLAEVQKQVEKDTQAVRDFFDAQVK